MTAQLQSVREHIWYFPPDPDAQSPQPGVGIIITPNATVLVDAGNSPQHARQIRTVLREITAPPVAYIIYTHHHWDHTFGAQIWGQPIVVADEQCRTLLLETYGSHTRHTPHQDGTESAASLASAATQRVVGDWNAFRLVPPHITFTGKLSLNVDERTISLTHIGGQHAPDSIIVRCDDVLFLGDCYYPPPMYLREPEDTLDFAMIEALLAEQAAIYIDAHGLPRTHAEFGQLLAQR